MKIFHNNDNKIMLDPTNKIYFEPFVLSTGLKSVWEFDETSGSTLVDQLGVQNLTKQSNVTVNNDGKIGKCIYFPGATNSATNIFNNANYSNLAAYTVNLWVKDARLGSGTGGAYYMAAGQQTGFKIFADYNGPYIRAAGQNYLGQNWAATISGASMPTNPNVWFMVSVTMNTVTGLAKIYKNGAIVQTDTINLYAGPPLTNNWTISSFTLGTYYDGITYDTCIPESDPCKTLHMQGYLDQLGIWTRELSDEEIYYLYNAGNGRAYSTWV